MKCINCGKESSKLNRAGFGFVICKDCDDAGDELADMLEQGIDLEYSDRTKETIKVKK